MKSVINYIVYGVFIQMRKAALYSKAIEAIALLTSLDHTPE
jgi:hypothetical protein